MSMIASQITSLTHVYSTVYLGADQRKHQCSASLAFVRGIHRRPVNSPHKAPVTRKMFPFDDVIMNFTYLTSEGEILWGWGWVGLSFVSSTVLDVVLQSLLYAISYHVGLRHNGTRLYVDCFALDCCNSIANTLELPKSCARPSLWEKR